MCHNISKFFFSVVLFSSFFVIDFIKRHKSKQNPQPKLSVAEKNCLIVFFFHVYETTLFCTQRPRNIFFYNHFSSSKAFKLLRCSQTIGIKKELVRSEKQCQFFNENAKSDI
jgi:hypothetical protein